MSSPTVGSQPSCTEKSSISTRPSANAGNEMPDTASVMPTRSGQRLRHTADTTPIAMPMSTDHSMLHTVSQNVGMKRSAIFRHRPMLPDRSGRNPKHAAENARNCCGNGRSRPRSLRTARRPRDRVRARRKPRRIAGQQVDEQEYEEATASRTGMVPASRRIR